MGSGMCRRDRAGRAREGTSAGCRGLGTSGTRSPSTGAAAPDGAVSRAMSTTFRKINLFGDHPHECVWDVSGKAFNQCASPGW